MKIKFIAAACMALGASASFAATLACDTTSPVTTVNTCAPEVRLFVAGSSALGNAITAVAPADLFDTTTTPLIKIKDTSGGAQAASTSAWYGMSKAALTGGTSKRLYVVYNNNNGSAAGVSLLFAKLGTVAEADVVTVGPTKAVPNTCAADSSSTALVPVVDCASHAPTLTDVAISDTHPAELYALYAAAAKGKMSSLTSVPLALQGFGVAVNANLYAALQTQNLADSLIPATCVAGDMTAACQPTIRSADYSSLISKVGSVKSAGALLGNSDSTVLTLARRDDLSGTQASSNIFFANNSCGNNVVKGKVVAGILGGKLDIVGAADSTAALVVQENATTGGVKTALNATSGYTIGVLGLGTVPGSSDTWKYVKIDRVSPTFNADGTAAYKQRTGFTTGNYPFAMTAFAAYPTKAPKTGAATVAPAVIPALIAGLKDSTLHDLAGIGYLDGAADAPATPKQSLVHRNLGNNCSPLIK